MTSTSTVNGTDSIVSAKRYERLMKAHGAAASGGSGATTSPTAKERITPKGGSAKKRKLEEAKVDEDKDDEEDIKPSLLKKGKREEKVVKVEDRDWVYEVAEEGSSFPTTHFAGAMPPPPPLPAAAFDGGTSVPRLEGGPADHVIVHPFEGEHGHGHDHDHGGVSAASAMHPPCEHSADHNFDPQARARTSMRLPPFEQGSFLATPPASFTPCGGLWMNHLSPQHDLHWSSFETSDGRGSANHVQGELLQEHAVPTDLSLADRFFSRLISTFERVAWNCRAEVGTVRFTVVLTAPLPWGSTRCFFDTAGTDSRIAERSKLLRSRCFSHAGKV